MSDDNKKSEKLESEFRKLVLDQLTTISKKQELDSKCLNHVLTELKLHKQETKMRLKAIEERNGEQNGLLSEHSSRSDRLEKDNLIREKRLLLKIEEQGLRVSTLEQPRKWLKTTGAILVWLGGIATAAYWIGRLVGWWL